MCIRDRCTSVDEVKCRFQVHVDYHIPLLFAHTHHQTVASDTGIVYQYIDKMCIRDSGNPRPTSVEDIEVLYRKAF